MTKRKKRYPSMPRLWRARRKNRNTSVKEIVIFSYSQQIQSQKEENAQKEDGFERMKFGIVGPY